MSSKITIIGAGSVGSTIAYTLSNEDIASEIVLIDINKKKVEGEVMDIAQVKHLVCLIEQRSEMILMMLIMVISYI